MLSAKYCRRHRGACLRLAANRWTSKGRQRTIDAAAVWEHSLEAGERDIITARRNRLTIAQRGMRKRLPRERVDEANAACVNVVGWNWATVRAVGRCPEAL